MSDNIDPRYAYSNMRRAYEGYLLLFAKDGKPGDEKGFVYRATGKESPKDLTRQDFEKIFQVSELFPHRMIAMLAGDDATVASAVTPNGMTTAELHHLMLQQLARQAVPTDIFRGNDELNASVPEDSSKPRIPEPRDNTITLNDETLNLKKSEAYAYAYNQALMLAGPTADLTDQQKQARETFMKGLTEQERRSIEEVRNGSDVKLLAAGYATGAVPTFSPRLNPESPNTLNITIGDANTTAQQIQNWFCTEIDKVYNSSGLGVDQQTAYTLGFIQARTDAKNGFQGTSVGLTQPCPPASTPSTGIANGNGTSAAPSQAGGGANMAPNAKGR